VSPSQLYVLVVGDEAGDAVGEAAVGSHADATQRVASALQALPGGLWHHRVAGEAALREALRTYRPDVILCDAGMPGFGGREALAVAAELAPKVPFVVVAESTAAAATLPGVAELVPKDGLDALAPAILRALASADA
jgi:CheY-like chemotaxis protein